MAEAVSQREEEKRLHRNENARLNRQATQTERFMMKHRMTMIPAPHHDLIIRRPAYDKEPLPIPKLEEITYANYIHQLKTNIWQHRRSLVNLREEMQQQYDALAIQLKAERFRSRLLQLQVVSAEKGRKQLRKQLKQSRLRNSLLHRTQRLPACVTTNEDIPSNRHTPERDQYQMEVSNPAQQISPGRVMVDVPLEQLQHSEEMVFFFPFHS